MSGCGFSIQELCAVGDITLNRPTRKEKDQIGERDVAINLEIAATRIPAERFIGSESNWEIIHFI